MPVPNPTANGTLNSIAEIGAAPVTATKITPHSPMAFGFRRFVSPANTDSTVPSCRVSTLGSGLVVDIAPLFSTRSLAGKLSYDFQDSTTLPRRRQGNPA